MIERFERFSRVITEIHRLIVKISSDTMKQHGLSGVQARYLIIMSRHSAGITATRLASLSLRNKAEVSRSVAELEEKGMLEKRCKGTNYRASLFLTDKGRATAEDIADKAQRAVMFVGGSLDDSERENLYSALESIAKNLDGVSKNGIPHLNTEEKEI